MDDVLINDTSYVMLEHKINALLHEIEEYIGKDRWELLEKLESAYNEQQVIIINLIYKQGYKDCQKKMA